MCCIGVPLFNTDNILIAAVGISGSSVSLTPEKLDSMGTTISDLVHDYKVSY